MSTKPEMYREILEIIREPTFKRTLVTCGVDFHMIDKVTERIDIMTFERLERYHKWYIRINKRISSWQRAVNKDKTAKALIDEWNRSPYFKQSKQQNESVGKGCSTPDPK